MAEKTSGWRRIAKALVVAGVMSAGVAPAQRDGLQIRAFGVGAKNATLGVAQTPGCEGETAFEVYRSVQVGGPWQFVTNDLLRPEEPARSYDLVRGPLKASEFFAVHLFVDFDGDGLSDMYERLETKTDPEVADTDGDGLSDGEEVALGTNPLTDDTDGDGIRDAEETGYGTDPTLCDTDGDGLDDYRELKEFGTNPCDASEDSDADGLSDAWELLYGYDRYMWNDASADGDSDGLTDGEECRYGTNPASEDTDGDGFGDRWEAMYCARLNPERAAEAGWSNIFDPVGREDTETFHEYDDGDGLTAYEECECGTNPFAADTDGDGLPDGWEVWSGLDPLDAEGDNGADGDPDGDWLTNAQEYELQTESLWQDSDNDGLPDGMEVMMYWTNPRNSDTDGDGLNDGDEALVHGTDPSVTDTDGDGLDDYEEVMIYSSDPNSRDSDADGDGMPDGWETENGTDPRNCDGTYDSDKDGLDNGTEYAIGTNPREPDTDGDTMHDGWEAKYWENTSGSGGEQEPSAKSMTLLERFTKFIPFVNNEDDDDPDNDANSDPDEDGMTNFYECQFGTNPHLADTDGDGVSDGDEVMQNSNPRDASDRGEKNSRVRVMILFGDHSASHSEKYMLHVAPADENDNLYDAENYNILNAEYGMMDAVELVVRENVRYSMWLTHASTDPNYDDEPKPDCDYMIKMIPIFPWVVRTEDPDGLITSSLVDDGVFAGYGKVARFWIERGDYSVSLVPDFNRDGRIDGEDEACITKGETFRFWVNDDNDNQETGDYVSGKKNVDLPSSSGDAEVDDRVNGKRDFVDFTPIALDLRSFTNCEQRSNLKVELEQGDRALNFVWTSLTADRAGDFQTRTEEGYGENLAEELEDAEMTSLRNGARQIPAKVVNSYIDSKQRAVFLIEGRVATEKPLVVRVTYDGRELASAKLKLRISEVEAMYRWLNLRDICHVDADASALGPASRLDEPVNRPDAETDGRNFVFVHGFNVNAQQARGWAAEMFKRLWQAGLESSFTAVDWYGDEDRYEKKTVLGMSIDSPNYYGNVMHAFATAQALKDTVSKLPGEKHLMAHSLGNMLVSAAIKDYGLEYSKYYMLNAAVCEEAYGAEVEREAMVDGEWVKAPREYWAANWSGLFKDSGDFREKLTWKGRFAGIRNAVNVYSESDDVLLNGEVGQLTYLGSAWKIQELTKGTTLWEDLKILSLTLVDVECEAGWGINLSYAKSLDYVYQYGFKESIRQVTAAEAVTNPLFTPFKTHANEMASNERFVIADGREAYLLQSKLLGDAIPALGFAAGANRVASIPDNRSLADFAAKDWPRGNTGDGKCEWRHSDLKNVAYYFTSELFKYMVGGRQ